MTVAPLKQDAKENFARNLLAHAGGLSPGELAQRTGLSRQQIYRYIEAEALPRADAFLRLCREVGMNPETALLDPDEVRTEPFSPQVLVNYPAPQTDLLPDGIYTIWQASVRQPGRVGQAFLCIESVPEGRRFWGRFSRRLFRHFTGSRFALTFEGFVQQIQDSALHFRGRFMSQPGRPPGAPVDLRVIGPNELDYYLGVMDGLAQRPGSTPISTKVALYRQMGKDVKRAFLDSRLLEREDIPRPLHAFFDHDESTVWGGSPASRDF